MIADCSIFRESYTTGRRVAVTGVTGHVGRDLARQLVASGAEVHGLTRQKTTELCTGLRDLTLHQVDGRTETLVTLFQDIRPDITIHLAALARRNHLMSDIIPFLDANILYGTQILEAMRLAGCRRFVTAESILQYAESGEFYPMNLYAATKQAFADLLQYYVGAFGVLAVSLVIPTVYSEHEKGQKLMTDTARSLQEGTTLKVHTMDVLIDLLHVEDVAAGFVRAASLLQEYTANDGGVLRRFCLTYGTDITPRELITLFERVGERKITVLKDTLQGIARRRNPWHGPVLPGWAPKIDLETGIRRMLSIKR